MGGPVMEEMLARKKFARGMIDFPAFLEIFRGSKGKRYTDEIRVVVQEFLTTNAKQSLVQKELLHKAARNAQLSIAIGIALSIVVGLLAITVIVRRATIQVNSVVSSVSGVAGELNNASLNLSSSSADLKNSTMSVASSVQRTSVAVEQIYAMMSKSLEETKVSTEILNSCREAAQKGRECVVGMSEIIRHIEDRTQELNQMIISNIENMREMSEQAKEISAKTKVIDDIVFQTKLLSFNASVEASRAGEHGKGFAVVAEEIGNLAVVSGGASKEINQLLSMNNSKIEKMVSEGTKKSEMVLKDFKKIIEENSRKSQDSLVAIDQIVEKVEELSGKLDQINVAVVEEEKGISEIRSSIESVEQFSNQNSVTAQKSSQLSENLEKQLGTLENGIANLSLVFIGKKSNQSNENLNNQNNQEDSIENNEMP